MCGIAGAVSSRRNVRNIVNGINLAQQHRGPDCAGEFDDRRISLGHTRLSILDLSEAGSQPYQFENIVLVYNGEIYNFREIRNALEEAGYSFDSDCDTEVLIKAWHAWGTECLQKIDGMFAFGLYEKDSAKLWLCRDQYGVKPVYFFQNDEELIFASELGSVIEAMDSAPEVDDDSIATYLALHFVPAPQTGFRYVSKLEAGTFAVFDVEQPKPHLIEKTRWADGFNPSVGKSDTSVHKLDALLRSSTTKQLVSDVPVGAFLSGGVDSSLLCQYASKASTNSFHTFSVGFTDVGEEHDETRFAQSVSKIVGSIHHPVQVELGSIEERVKTLLYQTDELNADTSVFLTDIVCEKAKEYVTVCLSGAGGDELFGGYYRHQAFLAMQYLWLCPEPIASLFDKGLAKLTQHRDTSTGNFVRRLRYFLSQKQDNGNFVAMLRNDARFRQSSTFLSDSQIFDFDSALAFDFTHFLGDNILSFTDRMSMRHSLEVRVPFLDRGVVSEAETMRRSTKTSLFEKKILLKALAAQYFPKELIYRKKQGFSAPIELWLRKYSVAELQMLSCDGLTVRYLEENFIKQMVLDFLLGGQDYSTQIYSFIVLNHWGRRYRIKPT